MTKLFNGNHLDLYSINSDFTGSRYFTIDQEEVEFHNATTIRIWFNEQSADFPSHWHTAMEILMPVENYYDVIVNDSSYHLLPGEILVIPPGELHELIAPNEETIRFPVWHHFNYQTEKFLRHSVPPGAAALCHSRNLS